MSGRCKRGEARCFFRLLWGSSCFRSRSPENGGSQSFHDSIDVVVRHLLGANDLGLMWSRAKLNSARFRMMAWE